MTHRLGYGGAIILCASFAFLYVPIALLILYSFNASKLVTVWGGFSTRWYWSLFENEQLLAAAWTSLKVAATSASLATILGALAAVSLVRHGRFRGRTVFTAMIYAPMVMPEVVIGLALLLLFVAVDMERGFWTVVVAHATLGMCFVTIVVYARLAAFDRSIEDSAMDLGASPLQAFMLITLPLIAPAVATGFLLAFTISLDDFVLASFTTGPGSTTLPMRIYSSVRLGVTPEINAISTLIIVFVAVLLALTLFVRRLGGAR